MKKHWDASKANPTKHTWRHVTLCNPYRSFVCDMPKRGIRSSNRTAFAVIAGVLLMTGAFSANEDSYAWPAQPIDSSLSFYAELVKETELRRRVNVLFPNSQSLFDGLQVGYVGVRHGNLTFRRRDLVAGTNPLAKFTRVYDSRFRHGRDFGPGWRLSFDEELTVADKGLVYRDSSGAQHAFRRAALGALGESLPVEPGGWAAGGESPGSRVLPEPVIYTAFPPTPQHESTSIEVAGAIAVVRRQGETRIFERSMGSSRIPNSYRLVRILSGEREILL